VGPRIPETWGGKNVALENDLCVCRCATPPRLMPKQTMRCQVIKDTGRALSEPERAVGVRTQSSQVYTDRFVLVDDHDGTPLPGREYAVVRASGKLEFGTSGADGQTHQLSTTPYPESVEIYAQGPMMSASLISPSGVVLHHRARRLTTPAAESRPKEVRLHASLYGPRQSRARAQPDEPLVFLPEAEVKT
jgi:hypothetical protein